MRALSKVLVVVGVLALVCGTSQAQQRQRPGGGRGGFGFGGGFLLTNPSVQKELGLSDSQKDKLKEAMTKVREDNKLGEGATREEMMKHFAKMRAATNKAIAGILEPKQLKRFKQIELQQTLRRGAMAIAHNAEVAKDLNLTDKQKKQLEEISAETRKKMQDLGRGEDARTKRQEIQKAAGEKAMGVLTAAQKKTLKELQGAPFKIERQARPGGGRGGQGGRRPRPNNTDK
jgi:Spy/CpxP family protein refolding chaperone